MRRSFSLRIEKLVFAHLPDHERIEKDSLTICRKDIAGSKQSTETNFFLN